MASITVVDARAVSPATAGDGQASDRDRTEIIAEAPAPLTGAWGCDEHDIHNAAKPFSSGGAALGPGDDVGSVPEPSVRGLTARRSSRHHFVLEGHSMRARGSLTVAMAGLMIALAACGGSDENTDANAAADTEDAGGGELETTDLTIGVLPLADYAAVYWAQDEGFFEDAGLNVTLQPISGGPVGIQTTVAGELDCSFANTIATVVAQTSDVPVTMAVLSSALGDESNVIVVKEDSPIQSIEDLDGATIGVNTTNNVGDVAFYNLLDAQGIDIDVQFVEVPFGEMIEGVQGGSIDATHVPEPFRSAALAAGLRPVADLTEEPNQDLPAAAFVCGDQFVQENPNTTRAFAEALYAAGGDMLEREADVRTWLPGVAGVPEEVAQNMKLPTYFSEPEPDQVERLVELLDGQGLLQGEYDLDDDFYQF
jgi:NitT/TauT family transport system substrate-binding protein